MIKRRPIPRPTESELEILRVLWSRGSSTVREVQEGLPRQPPRGYTTVLKLLQIMDEKGLVVRDASSRAHRYTARRAEEQTQRQLLTDLRDRAFNGSASKLVMQALSSGGASAAELEEIRRLLDELEGDKP